MVLRQRGSLGIFLLKIMEKWCGASLSTYKRPPRLNSEARLFLLNSWGMCLCFCNPQKDMLFLIKTAETAEMKSSFNRRLMNKSHLHVKDVTLSSQQIKITTHTFPRRWERVWENTSERSRRWRASEQNHIPEWTHMCKPSQVTGTKQADPRCCLNMSCHAL